MNDSLQVGILTIGTEVSNGQIINTNTAWIANELTNLRMNPSWHVTVADLKSDMLDALRFLQTKVEIIVVTGGLGPTSDDFTRNIISEWADAPLEYDAASWQHVLDRFLTLGVTEAPESNRQQCYFPKGARILSNARGTAHGFRIETRGVLCFVLPGPPSEIKAIWGDHIAAELATLSVDTDADELLRWQCLGLSESKLGEMIEDLIKGSSLVAGYRPHLPYIEIKIWCKKSQRAKEQHRIDTIDAALTPWTIGRDDEDVTDKLLPRFKDFDAILIDDQASLGAIAHRIGQKWTHQDDKLTILDSFAPHEQKPGTPAPNTLQLVIGPVDAEGAWEIWYKTSEVQKLQNLKLPYKRNTARADRDRLYICELSLAALARLADRGTMIL